MQQNIYTEANNSICFARRFSFSSFSSRIGPLKTKFLPDMYHLYSFKYNQQDATLYTILYYCQCSTCFGRFLRPSSGAQEL